MNSRTDILNDFELLIFRLTGFKCDCESIVRLNNKQLSVNGDFYFLTSFKFWKTILGDKLECHENCTDILQHYAHTQNASAEQVRIETNEKVKLQIVQSLISSLRAWDRWGSKYKLTKDRVCFFFNRLFIIESVITTILNERTSYGKSEESKNESVKIVLRFDDTSEMTSVRLYALKHVCKRILELQGYCTDPVMMKYDKTILLTSKSLKNGYEKCDVCICGPVENSQTNAKEKTLTCEEYVKTKMEICMDLVNQCNAHPNKLDNINKSHLENYAILSTYFELLSAKPSHRVFINLQTDVNKSCTNTKGIGFINYNLIRIDSVLNKLYEGIKSKEYSPIINVQRTDFSVLNDEDEWELVYNFLFKYPQVIKDSISLKPNLKLRPHLISMFLSQLVQKFSAYYSKTRILTKGAEHLHMQLSARIHMLEALKIVLQNGIEIFNIERRVNDDITTYFSSDSNSKRRSEFPIA